MNTEPKDQRVYTRINSDEKNKIMRACSTIGLNINQFMVQSALEKANKILEQEHTIKLNKQEMEHFIKLIENPKSASNYLKKSAREYKDSDLYNKE